jgi:putative tricarboxylic transport membrane protein
MFLDVAIGFSLSLAVYLMFTKLLSLSLPQGPLERLF